MTKFVKVPYWESIDGRRFPEDQEANSHRNDAIVRFDRATEILRDKSCYHSTAPEFAKVAAQMRDLKYYPYDALVEIAEGLQAEMRARSVKPVEPKPHNKGN